jgi:L-ascorbate metabolism protein UlaG (beta-lactamase superfamily)
MSDVRFTHIGGPTVLIEVAGWRILTDPTFDPPGRRYSFGWGTASTKQAGAALPAPDVPPVDAVLLTHHHHADNLDTLGRAMLPSVGTVLTTGAGAAGLGGNAVGLAPWATHALQAPGRPSVVVTATPCRHGPPLSRPITGHVIGFALQWEGQEHGQLWVSGDTVLYDGVREVPDRLDVGTVLLHLGSVQFGITGPLRYTMTGAEGAELCVRLQPHTVLPVHYEGWSHFQEGRPGIEAAFAAAAPAVRDTLHWLTIGKPGTVTV